MHKAMACYCCGSKYVKSKTIIYTDKKDLAKNIPITALIPHILGDLLVISMCSPVWALCFYPFSTWSCRRLTSADDAQVFVSPSATIEEAKGV